MWEKEKITGRIYKTMWNMSTLLKILINRIKGERRTGIVLLQWASVGLSMFVPNFKYETRNFSYPGVLMRNYDRSPAREVTNSSV